MNHNQDNLHATDAVDDAAARWHARIMLGPLTEVEEAELQQWLSESADNREAFTQYSEMQDLLDDAGAEILAREFENELAAQEYAKTSSPQKFAALAAALTLFVSAVAGFMYLSTDSKSENVFATEIGERKTVLLDDGSAVGLNTNTKLSVEIDRRSRTVSLGQGQATFTVQKEPQRPFVVVLNKAEVLVTGTVFDIDTYDERSRISVLSGTVDVMPVNGEKHTLIAGDQISIDEAGVPSPVTAFDPNITLAWRSGRLRFSRTPLGDVLTSINRYFETSIEVGDPDLLERPVTGEFDVTDQESIIRALTIIF